MPNKRAGDLNAYSLFCINKEHNLQKQAYNGGVNCS